MRTTHYVLLAVGALFLVFQNCAPVAFDSTELLNDGFNRPVEPNFVEMKAGPDQSFPRLKLVFVVDNSGTMGVNQINLSKAFEKMFDGDNASNLAPFETDAIIISTAQASLYKNDPVFNRLPATSVDQIADMSYPTLMSTYRGQLLDGQVPGDLVGYQVKKQTSANGYVSLDYSPAPLTAFSSFGMKSRASQQVHLARGGDIEAFKQDFRDRLALLNPDRSMTATVNGVKSGILDPVVDKESGLCSIARLLKSQQGFVNAGELASFVVVTDEDDSDPQGARCLESIRELDGSIEYNDGRCERPQTQLSFREAIANPTQPKCTVNYRRGFSYSYSYPVTQTSVTVYRDRYYYKVPQTTISYYTYAGYDHDEYKTSVTYYTSAPTYQIPQTKITYYREVEDCVIRDGIKTQCTYTYPSTDITVNEAYTNNCSTFVSGKLPSNALTTKAGYEPKCMALAPLDRTGACSASDTDKINCNQNYSAPKTTELAGQPTANTAAACATFVNNKLGAGAVYTAAGYVPTCGTITTIPKSVATGSCPTSGVSNCRNKPLTLNGPMTIEKTYNPATKTCQQFIKDNKSDAVIDQLATYPVSCAAASPTAEKAPKYGTCPTTDINVVGCRRDPELQAAKKYDGVVANGQSCLDFVNTLSGLPSNTIKTAGQYEPTCGTTSIRTAGPVTASFLFSDSAAYAALDTNKGQACPQAVIDAATASKGVAPSSCTIGDPTMGSQEFANVTCSQTDVAGYCSSSNGYRKNCTGVDTAAGGTYEANATNRTYDGTFTCATKCSDTTFCPSKSGTVGDNYYACSTTPQSPRVISTFTANPAPTCLAGDTKVYTREKYRSMETVEVPVVDKSVTGTDKLSEYINLRSTELFGDNTPFVSVFTRQPGDPLGTNGSIGEAYSRFAGTMNGQKYSVLEDADGYAEALKGLSTMIRERLARSFSVGVMAPDHEIRRVWHRREGTSAWGKPVDASLWTAKGSALTLSKDFPLEYGDEFKIEYW